MGNPCQCCTRFIWILSIVLLYAAATGSAGQVSVHGEQCKRLLWFMAVRESDSETTNEYLDYLTVALLSAKARAPSLVPHLIYDGQANSFTDWFRAQGGVIIFTQLSFMELLRKDWREHKGNDDLWLRIARGTFLRLEIPVLIQRLRIPPDVNSDYFLYTDSDVLFLRDVNSCSFPAKPRAFLMGPEHIRGTMANAGILYVNTTAMLHERAAVLKFAAERGLTVFGMDQSLLIDYFGRTPGAIGQLPDHLNYKAYWGWSEAATIVHFHGPKPLHGLDCLAAGSNADFRQRCPEYEPYRALYAFGVEADGARFIRYTLRVFRSLLLQSPRAFRAQLMMLPPKRTAKARRGPQP